MNWALFTDRDGSKALINLERVDCFNYDAQNHSLLVWFAGSSAGEKSVFRFANDDAWCDILRKTAYAAIDGEPTNAEPT